MRLWTHSRLRFSTFLLLTGYFGPGFLLSSLLFLLLFLFSTGADKLMFSAPLAAACTGGGAKLKPGEDSLIPHESCMAAAPKGPGERSHMSPGPEMCRA